jgi:hypothetical protein
MTNPMTPITAEKIEEKLHQAMPCFDCDGDGQVDDMDSVVCGDRSCCSPARMRCEICGGTGLSETARYLLSLAKRVAGAPVAIMDTRDALGICAPTEEDFPALYALQGKRVLLVEIVEE